MATWHQRSRGIGDLWMPVPGMWKCVSDRPDEFASCMLFDSKEKAEAYCKVTGDVLIPPARGEK